MFVHDTDTRRHDRSFVHWRHMLPIVKRRPRQIQRLEQTKTPLPGSSGAGGGGSGIRTHEEILPPTRFPVVPVKPLPHPSLANRPTTSMQVIDHTGGSP